MGKATCPRLRFATAALAITIAAVTLALSLAPLYEAEGAISGRIYLYKYTLIRVGRPVASEVLSSAYTVFLLATTVSIMGAGAAAYAMLPGRIDDESAQYLLAAVYGVYLEAHMILLAFTKTVKEEVTSLLVPSTIKTTAGLIRLPTTRISTGPLAEAGSYLLLADFLLLGLVLLWTLYLARRSPRRTSS